MEITSYRQAADYANEKFKHASMREFVYGFDEISHRDIKGIGAAYKLICLEFLMIYLKWVNTSRRELYSYKSLHFENANRVLFSLYKTARLDLDVMIYTLTEAQRDVEAEGEASFFYGMIDAAHPCNYGRLYRPIYEWMRSLQTSEGNQDKLLSYFVGVLQNVSALTDASVTDEKKGEDVFSSFEIGGETYRAMEMLYTDKFGARYILTARNYFASEVQYDYMSIDGASNIIVMKKIDRSKV
jgi:hypothetical protein